MINHVNIVSNFSVEYEWENILINTLILINTSLYYETLLESEENINHIYIVSVRVYAKSLLSKNLFRPSIVKLYIVKEFIMDVFIDLKPQIFQKKLKESKFI